MMMMIALTDADLHLIDECLMLIYYHYFTTHCFTTHWLGLATVMVTVLHQNDDDDDDDDDDGDESININ